MKKYDKTFFILYDLKTGDFYNSADGLEQLTKVLGKSRRETLTSLRRYLKNDKYIIAKDGTRLSLLNSFMLGGKGNDKQSKHKRYL